jgi:hypothetical protein
MLKKNDGSRAKRSGVGPFTGTHLTIIIVTLGLVIGFPEYGRSDLVDGA